MADGVLEQARREQAEAFGAWLRAWLAREGRTQKWLAETTDISTSTVHHYVTGRHLPKAEAVNRLAAAMRLPIEEVSFRAGLDLAQREGSPLRLLLRRIVEDVPEHELDQAVKVLETFLPDRPTR